MLRFSCKCGYEFNLTDDRAGEMIQCPRCGLLVDAPRADELAWLGPDGTYAVDDSADAAPPPPGTTLAEMYRTYSRRTSDEYGVEKDLRPGAGHYDHLGDEDDTGRRPRRIAPRYDPVTGERILPLELKDEPVRPAIPVAAEVEWVELDEAEAEAELAAVAVEPIPVAAIPVTPGSGRSLGYATADVGHHALLHSLPVDLLVRPGNATVMVFAYAFYVAGIVAKYPLAGFCDVAHVPMAAVMLVDVPLWLLAAHFGCVVDDVGPEGIDELPRPLRNLSFGEDLFGPAVRVAAAVAICFGPAAGLALAAGSHRPPATAGVLLLGLLGAYGFPAVLLTLLTGTTVLNLTPGRVAGVIGRCGPQYVLSVLLGLATLASSVGIVLGPGVLPPLGRLPFLLPLGRLPLLVPALAGVVYVTHLFAWHLGLMYRAHHDAFPWLAQRHIPTPRPPRRRPAYLDR